MNIETRTPWVFVEMDDRVDSFNYDEVTGQISKAMTDGPNQLALDLKKVRFLSFTTIRYFSNLAEDLRNQGGRLALVAPSEKLKRQFDIFASLDSMSLYRSYEDWERTVTPTV